MIQPLQACKRIRNLRIHNYAAKPWAQVDCAHLKQQVIHMYNC